MSLDSGDPLECMTPAELIGLVRTLIGEVTRLRAENEKLTGALVQTEGRASGGQGRAGAIEPRNGSCKPIKWYNLLNSLVFPTKISNAEQLTTVQQFQ